MGLSESSEAVLYRAGQTTPKGHPQNAHIESFNGKLRNECLNLEWFMSLREAREVIQEWRNCYNGFRPHSALNNLPPEVWLQKQQNKAEKLYTKLA